MRPNSGFLGLWAYSHGGMCQKHFSCEPLRVIIVTLYCGIIARFLASSQLSLNKKGYMCYVLHTAILTINKPQFVCTGNLQSLA